jgi:hypothetical protein
MPNWIKRREDELLAEGKTMALQVLDHLKEMLRDRGFDPYVDVNEMGILTKWGNQKEFVATFFYSEHEEEAMDYATSDDLFHIDILEEERDLFGFSEDVKTYVFSKTNHIGWAE